MRIKIITLVLMSALLGLAACGEKGTPTPTPTAVEQKSTAAPTEVVPKSVAMPGTATSDKSSNADYLQIFETVWQTVNETYFDPTFGGLDWQAVHDRYRPLIAAAQDDPEFYHLVNQMIWELDVSHGFVASPEYILYIIPENFASGSAGMDVRLLDGEAVVVSVTPGSPAEGAGLRPGHVIRSIDGDSIEQIIAEEEKYLAPPYNSRGRIQYIMRRIWGRIYGSPDTSVAIAYSDESGETYDVNILRKARGRKSTLFESFPPQFLEFESKRLDNDIGYIRFNTFHPGLVNDFASAVRDLHDAHGLIIDLRGNPGGDGDVVTRMAGQLVAEQTLLFTARTRDEVIDFTLRPAESVFEGLVVILIDATCTSGSELFPAVLQ